jgi:hypothetical protein
MSSSDRSGRVDFVFVLIIVVLGGTAIPPRNFAATCKRHSLQQLKSHHLVGLATSGDTTPTSRDI